MGRPAVISLYSGAGGLDYGFEAAGFRTAVALDSDHDSCETLRRSRRRWPVIERAIADVPTAELLRVGGLRKREAALVIGGPPCQPFSKSGYWHSGDSLRLDDPRADTLRQFFRVVEEALPHAFLLENVEGLAFDGKDEAHQLLYRLVERINRRTRSRYRPVAAVLNAASYGVPQLRSRFFFVAARDGTPFDFDLMQPTHGAAADDELLLSAGLDPYRTAWDAIGDLEPEPNEDLVVRGKWADLIPSIPEGQNYLYHTARGDGLALFGWRTRYWNFLLKLSKDLPSWTIQAQPGPSVGPFHWTSRRLSTRELCRLQTFPDDVTIIGDRMAAQRQIGNAVPSLLAEVLARAIRTQLLRMRPRRGPLHLLPPDRGPAPDPEPVRMVPAKFQSLIGDHAAHPGTGKGRGAQLRLGIQPDLWAQVRENAAVAGGSCAADDAPVRDESHV